MPNTSVFSGHSSQWNQDKGGIEVTGKKDKAKIIFTDTDHQQSVAHIQVYTKAKLIFSRIYQKTEEYKMPEDLVSQWFTRRNHNTIIKYAGNSQLAFVFEIDKKIDTDIDRYLELLTESGEVNHIDYFKEVQFCRLLAKYYDGMTIQDLKIVPGMSAERIAFLMNHSMKFSNLGKIRMSIETIGSLSTPLLELLIKDFENTIHLHNSGFKLSMLDKMDGKTIAWIKANSKNIHFLLNNEITPEQVLSIDRKKLDHFFKYANFYAENALKYITLNQALGIDHIPRPVVKIPDTRENQWVYLGSTGGGSSGAYSYHHDGKSIKVRYKKSIKFELTHGQIKDNISVTFNKESDRIQLVNQWYSLNNGTTFYSPDTRQIMVETFDPDFPVENFKSTYGRWMLRDAPFFQELDFVTDLKEKGCPIDELHSLQGMTQEKIAFIFTNRHSFFSLISAGVSFSEIAETDEQRLYMILEHYNEARTALKFVSARELLGLNHNSPSELPLVEEEKKEDALSLSVARNQILYRPADPREAHPENGNHQEASSSCLIM